MRYRRAMKSITDHKALIDALGGNKIVADGIADCTPGRVGQWKIGNRIPTEYWPDIIAMSAAQDIEGIDANWLMENMRPRQMPSPSGEVAPA